jgi:glyoxylase-like metal-dependent hydrolase (beta-lactamase superfamily II)
MTRPRRKSGSAAWEIAPDVYCLGPKGRTQTDVYFVRSGSSWTLIDAGWAKDAPAIKRAAEGVFGANARPDAILLTHVHPDHSGSALELARIWDRFVYVHPAELPAANGDAAAIIAAAGPLDDWLILPLLRVMGRLRRDAILAGSSLKGAARPFDPSAGVPGLPDWECIPTPGHTPGHVSFYRPSDRVLITGDALVTMRVNSVSGFALGRQGLSGPPWYTSWDWQAAKASVASLARLEPNVLAGGHGRPLTGAGTAAALRAFAEHFCGRATTGRARAGDRAAHDKEA